MAEAVVTLEEARTFETRGGNVRYVARDSEGKEYTTFREAIGQQAEQLQGRRVRIEYHEEERGRYTNVYRAPRSTPPRGSWASPSPPRKCRRTSSTTS